MLVHCWICNDAIILPAGPVSHVKKVLGDADAIRSHSTALCKAFHLPVEQFLDDLTLSYSCETCFTRLDEIKGVIQTLEELNKSLELLKNEVKRSLEHATGQSFKDNQGVFGSDGIDGLESRVKVEYPDSSDEFDGDEELYAGQTWPDAQEELNILRHKIINFLNPKAPEQSDWRSKYSDLEKDKKLTVKLRRLNISKIEEENAAENNTCTTEAEGVEWTSGYTGDYNSQDEGNSRNLRKSKRKRKIPFRLKENVGSEFQLLNEDEDSKFTIKEDPEDTWQLPSDEEITEEQEELPKQPIKLLQYKGKKAKPTNSVFCEKCNRNYGSSFDLQTHMRKRHEGIYRPFSCDFEGCGKSFRLRSSWLHHKQFHLNGQEEKRYVCTDCGKSYETNNSLQRHVSVHTGKWKYPCTYEGCDKGFHRPSELKAHVVRCHERREEFQCNFCSERFLTKRKQVFHESSVHPEEPLNTNTSCDYCHKVFSSVDALRCHKIQIHSEESKFRCEECGHGFAKLSWLNRHKLQHSTEKTFSCEYCDEKFRFPNSLAAHKMKHEGKFPHVCTVCGKKFTLYHQLKIHLSVHSSEKSYVCEYCGKTFSVHTYLRHHVRRMHFKELGLSELPVYYLREKNRKKKKKIITTTATSNSKKSKAESEQKRKIKLARALENCNKLKDEEQQQMECILSGMNVGEETLIITNTNGSANVEVEFVNVDVLEYVVETYEEGVEVESQEELIKEGEMLEQVEVIHHHELEAQKIETDPFIEFIVTQAN